jgi:hypothetical protein
MARLRSLDGFQTILQDLIEDQHLKHYFASVKNLLHAIN